MGFPPPVTVVCVADVERGGGRGLGGRPEKSGGRFSLFLPFVLEAIQQHFSIVRKAFRNSLFFHPKIIRVAHGIQKHRHVVDDVLQ